jgi:hypothetical protein
MSLQLSHTDIEYFNICNRENNDKYNKKRELIIKKILNNEIPNDFYTNHQNISRSWRRIRDDLRTCIKEKYNEYNGEYNNLIVKHMGGRMYNYDFKFIFDNKDEEFKKIEFKFNCNLIDDTPQFSSPTKPSEYFINKQGFIPFEEYFYDNYFLAICEKGNLPIPSREIYLKEINNNSPECLTEYKKLYKTNKQFAKFCKKQDFNAIKNYLKNNKLDFDALNNYLHKTQKDKIYLLYKDGDFKFETKPREEYTILKEHVKIENKRVICYTKSNKKIEIRLRFKNCLGLAFPALQIKNIDRTVKELKQICNDNKIFNLSSITKAVLKQKLIDNNIKF